MRSSSQLKSPSRNRSSMSLGRIALIAAVFILSGTTSMNFDSCSTCNFLVRLGAMSRATDEACCITDLGLNHFVTACQPWSPFPGSTLRILLTGVATSPRVHVTGAAAMPSLSCQDIPVPVLQGLNRVTLAHIQFGDFPQQCTALSIA